MSDKLTPCVRPLSQCEPYEQDEPGISSFRTVSPENEIPSLCMGYVTLEGPIVKTPGTHDEWDQVYLVLAGTATVHLNDQSFRITEPSAVMIPHGTMHSVELKAGEKIQYVYVNRWL